MTTSTFTRILYASLLPAILLVPYWFQYGRLLFIGGKVLFYGDFVLNYQCLPGVVFFHVLLWWRERQRTRPSTTVALGLAATYLFQFIFQMFYYDEDLGHITGDSVVSHFFHVSRTNSRTLAFSFGVILWASMIATLISSAWIPLHEEQADQTSLLSQGWFRNRMTQTIRPSVWAIPLWFAAGHTVLGNGWGWGMELYFLFALVTFLPAHYCLWRRWKHQQQIMVSLRAAWILLAYYITHFIVRPFAWEGFRSGASFIETYAGLSTEICFKIFLGLVSVLFLEMIVLFLAVGF